MLCHCVFQQALGWLSYTVISYHNTFLFTLFQLDSLDTLDSSESDSNNSSLVEVANLTASQTSQDLSGDRNATVSCHILLITKKQFLL